LKKKLKEQLTVRPWSSLREDGKSFWKKKFFCWVGVGEKTRGLKKPSTVKK